MLMKILTDAEFVVVLLLETSEHAANVLACSRIDAGQDPGMAIAADHRDFISSGWPIDLGSYGISTFSPSERSAQLLGTAMLLISLLEKLFLWQTSLFIRYP